MHVDSTRIRHHLLTLGVGGSVFEKRLARSIVDVQTYRVLLHTVETMRTQQLVGTA